MAQVMMNLIYKKPRFDFDADYFMKTIRAECVILRHTTTLIKNIMDKQVSVSSKPHFISCVVTFYTIIM